MIRKPIPTACEILMNSLRSAVHTVVSRSRSKQLRIRRHRKGAWCVSAELSAVAASQLFWRVVGVDQSDIRFVHLLMNWVPSLKKSLGSSAISCSRSDILLARFGWFRDGGL